MTSDVDFLIAQNNLKPTRKPLTKISEYVQGKRILPPGTPFPGYWDNDRTPYLIEPMDCMGPGSVIQHVVFMKPSQIGGTAMAENVIAYWIDENPSEILFISATEELLQGWSIKRLDPLIDSCGFRSKIFSQSQNKNSKRLGDKIFSKEFIGGNLDMASAQGASGLRSDSKRILIRDEIDGAPRNLRTGEGNWIKVSKARTDFWGSRKKILDFSTPTILGDSQISETFEVGDKREYQVPCPRCKKFQILEFEPGADKLPWGLKAEFEKHILKDVFYICRHCRYKIQNHQKTWMLRRGKWEPTAISQIPNYRSYHLNSLYSPVGAFSWKEFYQEYLEARETPDGMRSFTNLKLGLPFRETGTRPDLQKVIELRGNYTTKNKIIPSGILYLTAGIDVQSGSETDPDFPPRIELEILGTGTGYRNWQVLYKVIKGSVDQPFQGAWEGLNKFAEEGGLQFHDDRGNKLEVNLIFIDSGDGDLTDIVYRFCQSWNNTYPCKGFGIIKNKSYGIPDEFGHTNFKRYRAAKIGDITLYEISTNYYKTQIYNNLKIERQPGKIQRPGFCEFPRDTSEDYFKGLTSEVKRSDGSFTNNGRRNEPLDIRVYGQCAADVYLDSLVADYKTAARQKGITNPVDLQKINYRFVLEQLQKRFK